MAQTTFTLGKFLICLTVAFEFISLQALSLSMFTLLIVWNVTALKLDVLQNCFISSSLCIACLFFFFVKAWTGCSLQRIVYKLFFDSHRQPLSLNFLCSNLHWRRCFFFFREIIPRRALHSLVRLCLKILHHTKRHFILKNGIYIPDKEN